MNNQQLLTNDDIEKAYQALPEHQRAKIDHAIEILITEMQKRYRGNSKLMFGRISSLELLAKTGIWLDEKVASK